MRETNYSKEIVRVINNYLTNDDRNFSFDEQNGMFQFGLSLKSKIKKINYIVDVKKDKYIVYAVSPIGADQDDKEMMASMAEFICRANYGLVNGNFEFDMRDGEIRFKSFVDCDGMMPTAEVVKNSIRCPAAVFKQYGAGIVDIIFGNVTAKEAIERCEKSSEAELRSLVSELIDSTEDADIEAFLANLTGQRGLSDEGAPAATEEEPMQIKTDLFGTEGGDA